MLFQLLLLFTLIPLVELALLIKVGQIAGLGTTIALVLVTGILGAALAKMEGLKTYHRIHTELSQGRLPGDSMIDALLILVAGALLITPGLLTDCTGFLLLLPPARSLLRGYLKRRFRARFVIRGTMQSTEPHRTRHREGDQFIDVEAYAPEDEDPADGR